MFHLGTDDNPNKVMTVDCSDYTDSTEPSLEPDDEFINIHDTQRSLGEAWAYLLKHLTPGLLFCKRRGNLLIIAAGHVSQL